MRPVVVCSLTWVSVSSKIRCNVCNHLKFFLRSLFFIYLILCKHFCLNFYCLYILMRFMLLDDEQIIWWWVRFHCIPLEIVTTNWGVCLERMLIPQGIYQSEAFINLMFCRWWWQKNYECQCEIKGRNNIFF